MLTSENEIQKLKMRGAVSGNPFFQSLSKVNAATLRDNLGKTQTRVASFVPNSEADDSVQCGQTGLKPANATIKNSSFFKDPASISPNRDIQKRPRLDSQTFSKPVSLITQKFDLNCEKILDAGTVEIKNDYVSETKGDHLAAGSTDDQEDNGSQDTFVEACETSPDLVADQSFDFVDAYISAPEVQVSNRLTTDPLDQHVSSDIATTVSLGQTLSESAEPRSNPLVPLQLLNLPEEGFHLDFGFHQAEISPYNDVKSSESLSEGEPLVIVAPKVLELSRTSSGASLSQIIRGWEATFEKSQAQKTDQESNGYFTKQNVQSLEYLPKLSLAPLELSNPDGGLDIDFESVARFPKEKEEIKRAEPIRWIKVQSVEEMPVAASLYIPPAQTGVFDAKTLPADSHLTSYLPVKIESSTSSSLPPLPPRPMIAASKEKDLAEATADTNRKIRSSSPSKKVSFGAAWKGELEKVNYINHEADDSKIQPGSEGLVIIQVNALSDMKVDSRNGASSATCLTLKTKHSSWTLHTEIKEKFQTILFFQLVNHAYI